MTLSRKYKQRILVLIITASIFGNMIFGSNLSSSTKTVVEIYDLVTIDYQMWESDYAQSYDSLNPILDEILVITVIPLTEDPEKGIILGLYNNIIGKGVHYESSLIWLDKCIDQDSDGIDDFTGKPALTYGNSSHMYFNTCLMVQFRVLDVQKYGYIPPIELDPAVIYGVIAITLLLILAGIIAFAIWKREPVQVIEKPQFIFLYDPNTLKKMTKENKDKRTKHYKEGFEPCYDWGEGTEFVVPKWAEEVVDRELKRGKKDGRIAKDRLPSNLTAQKIEYCTYFYKDDMLVLRAYRRIHPEDSKITN